MKTGGLAMVNILIVDDDDLTRELIASKLKQRDYETCEAADGDEALDRARNSAPDLILLDMNLPRMTGWELAPLLRSHPRTENIPIIALTGDESTEAVEAAHDAGCDRYLKKPIDFDRLVRAIEELT
ncbi:MAG: response regulator [Rhodospirillales bacterium]